ncbi:MAG: UDP-N-acetylmuramoyl-tripeptide--D-alanyl-D-alanine ligase [Bacteroidetes bacterium]|nr:MAG: UDP-N-acetylmuramoyl-tripeptide--D-alanyl-D-alanine ligase [Bacteroidota bacterium]
MEKDPSAINTIHRLILQGATVSIDSRTIEKGSVFFALKGENFDANHFAAGAIKKGAAIAVVDNKDIEPHEQFVFVEDVLQALQDVASQHRDLFKIPVIGITGSNGKTTTKEILHAVLSRKFNTLCTKGNFNNHIGVPLTLLNLTKEHQVAIIEMGANHIGEIAMLSSLAKPTSGLITNIGKAHIEGFGSVENIVIAKTELYKYLQANNGLIFLNADNEILSKQVNISSCITYGKGASSRYTGDIVASSPFLEISFISKQSKTQSEKHWHIRTQLTGRYNFENIMAATAIGLHMGVLPEQIKEAIENYTPVNSRSQWKETGKNALIMDAYNANPTSMKAALDNFNHIETTQPKALILGDMLELGITAEAEHQEIIQFLSRHTYNFVLLVGSEFSKIRTLPSNYNVFPDTKTAAGWLENHAPENHTILLKGSRGIGLEQLECFL